MELPRCGGLRKDVFFEHLLFAINERIYVVGSEFEPVAMGNGIGRTGFHAVAAENTARIIYVVNRGVTFARRNAIAFGVFGSFDVNAIGRARCGTEEATDALLETTFVAMQDVNSAVARLKVYRLLRITFRGRFPEHGPEGHPKSVLHCPECFINFANRGCHGHEFIKRPEIEQTQADFMARARPAVSASAICFPWNLPFSMKISLVCRPPITTPAKYTPGILLS